MQWYPKHSLIVQFQERKGFRWIVVILILTGTDIPNCITIWTEFLTYSSKQGWWVLGAFLIYDIQYGVIVYYSI
jgi:hypothetical protein